MQTPLPKSTRATPCVARVARSVRERGLPPCRTRRGRSPPGRRGGRVRAHNRPSRTGARGPARWRRPRPTAHSCAGTWQAGTPATPTPAVRSATAGMPGAPPGTRSPAPTNPASGPWPAAWARRASAATSWCSTGYPCSLASATACRSSPVARSSIRPRAGQRPPGGVEAVVDAVELADVCHHQVEAGLLDEPGEAAGRRLVPLPRPGPVDGPDLALDQHPVAPRQFGRGAGEPHVPAGAYARTRRPSQSRTPPHRRPGSPRSRPPGPGAAAAGTRRRC